MLPVQKCIPNHPQLRLSQSTPRTDHNLPALFSDENIWQSHPIQPWIQDMKT
jgi:hypothetical protein